MPRRKRTAIPEAVSDDILYRSDLRCCVCGQRGVHIHHLDEDPQNNDPDNLVLLCFEHHHEASIRGGLSRKLTAGVLAQYRDMHYVTVERKRQVPSLESSDSDWFGAVIDAIAVREVLRLKYEVDWSSEASVLEVLDSLQQFRERTGLEARKAVLSLLADLSGIFRVRFFADVDRIAIRACDLTYELLPIRDLRKKSKSKVTSEEVGLLKQGVYIGSQAAYDGVLKVRNLRVADAGLTLLWRLLLYARLNNLRGLKSDIVSEFGTVLNAAKRGGEERAPTLVMAYRDHGLRGDWHFPKIAADIEKELFKF